MLNTTQLEAFLRQKFGPVKRSRGKYGLELITKCPVCGKRKLSVNASTGMYQCWHGCSSGHIRTMLGDVRLARSEVQRTAKVATGLIHPGELVPLTSLDTDHHAYSYLANRGFDPVELNDLYGIRYCAQGTVFAHGLFNTTNTLVIPIYRDGAVIGWQSRLLYDPAKVSEKECEALGFLRDEDGDWIRPPKYFTMPGLDKSQILWNIDWARKSNMLVICEGVFDAIAVGRCAVATFGKGVSEAQRGIISAYWDLAVALLDPDAAEDNAKLKWQLDGTTPTIFVNLRGYKDAGETPRLELWRQIDEAARSNVPPLDIGKYNFII